MSLGHQTITVNKVSMGRPRLRTNAMSHSSRVEPGRLVSLGDVNLTDTYYEHRGLNSTGQEQAVRFFKTDLADGSFEFELDEMHDPDTPPTWCGEVTDVEIVIPYPKNPTKGFRYLAAKALVEILSWVPGMKVPSRLKCRCRPYNDPGTALYTTNDDYTIP